MSLPPTDFSASDNSPDTYARELFERSKDS